MKKKNPNNKVKLTPVLKTKNKHSWNLSILKKEKITPQTPTHIQFQFENIDTVKGIISTKGGCKLAKKKSALQVLNPLKMS